MTADTFVALVLFVSVMVGTPGPANILVMAAGAGWGLRACLPFILGLTGGKMLLNLLMALGLLTLLNAYPLLAQGLRVASALYLLWLAWRIVGLRLKKADPSAVRGKPGFFAGLIVHPINPKAWAMSTAAYAQFISPQADVVAQSALLIATFFAVQWVFHPLWCYGGAAAAAKLGGTVWERVLMLGLALSLVLVVAWSMWSQW